MNSVTYNKSDRKWIVNYGDHSVEFDAKNNGKEKAQLLGLVAESPAIGVMALNIYSKMPWMKSRLIKAGIIAINDQVAEVKPGLYTSPGSNGNVYEIKNTNGLYTCTCPDHEQRRNTSSGVDLDTDTEGVPIYCKHVLATLILIECGIGISTQTAEPA